MARPLLILVGRLKFSVDEKHRAVEVGKGKPLLNPLGGFANAVLGGWQRRRRSGRVRRALRSPALVAARARRGQPGRVHVQELRQFDLPGTTIGSPAFGVISSQANLPRDIQLALKFLF